MTWPEFKKTWLISQAFGDSMWGKIKKDSQYQLHLEQFQAILIEFDPIAALNEDVLVTIIF